MQNSELAIPYTAAAYRMVWRWHFYAGLFCLPFIILLSISGSIYLFRPQIEAWADQSFNHLTLNGPAQNVDAQINTALAAVPHAKLKGVEVRPDATDATRIFVITPSAEEIRVVMRPDDLSILSLAPVKGQFSMVIRSLHGDLWAGTPGAILVELAASWAMVMIGTGLYLWWPSRLNSPAGILYPRFGAGGRTFLKDIHGVTGFWLSFMALFMLISGLPWTKVWGDGFRELRRMTQVATPPDWTNGPASEHAGHRRDLAQVSDQQTDLVGKALSFDAALVIARDLHLASPVLLSPPMNRRPTWLVKADPQNRPLGRSVELEAATGAIVKDTPFSTKPWMDQIIAYGVAAHEGQLFGWPNVALGLMAALGFMTISTTALLMWLRRRPGGTLGAPRALGHVRIHPLIVLVSIIILGALLPLFGASLILVLLVERFLLPFWPKAQMWLGLGRATGAA
jgi:uncharacterized iron-regulated membrane protein